MVVPKGEGPLPVVTRGQQDELGDAIVMGAVRLLELVMTQLDAPKRPTS
jgi:hypothetical protein